MAAVTALHTTAAMGTHIRTTAVTPTLTTATTPTAAVRRQSGEREVQERDPDRFHIALTPPPPTSPLQLFHFRLFVLQATTTATPVTAIHTPALWCPSTRARAYLNPRPDCGVWFSSFHYSARARNSLGQHRHVREKGGGGWRVYEERRSRSGISGIQGVTQ